MKKIITLLTVFTAMSCISQTTSKNTQKITKVTITNDMLIAYATPKRDTLFLLKEEPVAKLIKEIWDSYKFPEKPVIIVVSADIIRAKISKKNNNK